MKKKTREIKQKKKIKTTDKPSKTMKPDIKHFKLHQENLEDKKIEYKLKEEQQTENRKQLKGDDTEKNIETSSQENKQKQITFRRNDEKERNTGETKVEGGRNYKKNQ